MAKYHMHRKEQEITDKDQLLAVLKRGKYVTISMCRDNEPYIVTFSYGYDESKNALYFHSGLKGLKMEFIKSNPNVCATIIEDHGYLMNECSHKYSSLVFWGNIQIVEELEEKKHGMEILFRQLEENPEPIRDRNLKSDNAYNAIAILRLDILDLTGKAGG